MRPHTFEAAARLNQFNLPAIDFSSNFHSAFISA
jgi:hypothetical protein